MAKEGTLLVVDDNRNILTALNLLLQKHFERVIVLSTPNRIAATLAAEAIDVVLLDMNFAASIQTGNEGLYWLREIRTRRPEVQVVLFTAYADVELAVRAMKDGAVDFVVKPWDNERLVATLRRACELGRSRREVKQLREIRRTLAGTEHPMFWGTSRAMAEIRSVVEKVAATDTHILITGENGTGKEMLAQEIHRLSPRRSEPMVCVDMGAIPENLFESELFGHMKGSFTNACTDRAGKFEAAHGGTLFLDEIGNLPPLMQPKLLNAIQHRRIVRIGSNRPIETDIRLISATNRDLPAMVAEGTFREDLLYRINTIHLDLPPLRRRHEDILPLARMFLERYASKYGKTACRFDNRAEEELLAHTWPGNIRELQHTIEKAVILSDGETLSTDSLLLPQRKISAPQTAASTLEEMERQMIAAALDRNRGNLSAVAQELGITRQTLYNKIKRYAL